MLRKGALAPKFSLPNASGQTISLDDYKGKWVIVYFYPKDNTPGCIQQATDFSNYYDEFQSFGIDIIGINGDSMESHQNFQTKHNLKVILLSDPTKQTLSDYKVWGEKQFMGKTYEGLTRSTFIINPDGILEEAMYNIKAKEHASRVLRTIRQLLGA